MRENVFGMYLEEIKEIKSCDEAENQRLLRQIKGGDERAKDRLIEGNLRLALKLVQEYVNRGVATGDLVQEANMALVLAAAEFEDGVFEDFVRERVKDALLAAVEEQSLEEETAKKMLDRVNKLEDVSQEMARELGREATVAELAGRMEMTCDEVKEIMKLTLDAMSAHKFNQRTFHVRLINLCASDKNHLTKSGTKRLREYIRSLTEEQEHEIILDSSRSDGLECGGTDSGEYGYSLKRYGKETGGVSG